MGGNLIIVSAPSGTGKTTILKKVMQRIERLAFSVSHTTRAPRKGEQNGQDYYFIERDEFELMITDGAFLEWALVHDNYYGTAIAPIKDKLAEDFDVVLDIDVQGAKIIRQSGSIEFIDIFLAPPDPAELEKRLRKRGTEDEQMIATRLTNSVEEMAQSSKYQYLVVNDLIDEAVTMLCGIIYAKRTEAGRGLDGLPLSESMK